MPRIARLILDNTISHVFNRGNGKQITFNDDEDFEHFIYILAYYKAQYGFELYHECLMPNHFHFELKVRDGKILSRAMHDITQTYTKYHHEKYQTIGYLWQGRYKNMLVEEGDYHQKLGGYIERNPIRARLVENPSQWKWSSYNFYAYGEPIRVKIKLAGGEKWIDLLDEDPLYKEFGQTPEERQKNYREFILAMDDEKIKEYLGVGDGKLVIGTVSFREKMGEFFGKQGMRINLGPPGRPKKDKNGARPYFSYGRSI